MAFKLWAKTTGNRTADKGISWLSEVGAGDNKMQWETLTDRIETITFSFIS